MLLRIIPFFIRKAWRCCSVCSKHWLFCAIEIELNKYMASSLYLRTRAVIYMKHLFIVFNLVLTKLHLTENKQYLEGTCYHIFCVSRRTHLSDIFIGWLYFIVFSFHKYYFYIFVWYLSKIFSRLVQSHLLLAHCYLSSDGRKCESHLIL